MKELFRASLTIHSSRTRFAGRLNSGVSCSGGARMDPKLKELVARTNLGDLLQPTNPEIDLNQTVETAPPAKKRASSIDCGSLSNQLRHCGHRRQASRSPYGQGRNDVRACASWWPLDDLLDRTGVHGLDQPQWERLRQTVRFSAGLGHSRLLALCRFRSSPQAIAAQLTIRPSRRRVAARLNSGVSTKESR